MFYVNKTSKEGGISYSFMSNKLNSKLGFGVTQFMKCLPSCFEEILCISVVLLNITDHDYSLRVNTKL